MKNFFSRTKDSAIYGYFKFIFSGAFLFSSFFVKAQTGLTNPVNATSIPDFLKSIISAVTEIGTIVGALSIMYGGFLFATAQGDEEKISTAKKTITWALIGTAVLIGAQVIITVVSNTVGGITS
ncbi:MAG: pilin [bacterium]